MSSLRLGAGLRIPQNKFPVIQMTFEVGDWPLLKKTLEIPAGPLMLENL